MAHAASKLAMPVAPTTATSSVTPNAEPSGRDAVQEAQHRVRQCDGLRQHRRGESQVSLWCNSAPPNSVGWISALPTPQQTKLGRMADG